MQVLVLNLSGRFRIGAICDAAGEAQVVNALAPGGDEDQYAGAKRQMWAHLGHVAQLPYPPRNTTTAHQVDEHSKIYEFIKTDLRVMFFYDEQSTILLTHAFIKDGRKTPPAQIARARRAVTAYFEAKRKGTLRFVKEAD